MKLLNRLITYSQAKKKQTSIRFLSGRWRKLPLIALFSYMNPVLPKIKRFILGKILKIVQVPIFIISNDCSFLKDVKKDRLIGLKN